MRGWYAGRNREEGKRAAIATPMVAQSYFAVFDPPVGDTEAPLTDGAAIGKPADSGSTETEQQTDFCSQEIFTA